jgi:hypothetical protein
MRIASRALLIGTILVASPAAFSCADVSKASVASPAASVLGTTPTEIHARFVGVIEQNFRTGDPNKLVHALTSHELADLATLYKRAGGTTTLLELMAKHVDADGLTLVASAFGQYETEAAAASYSPKAIFTEFQSLPVKAAAAASPAIAARVITANAIAAAGGAAPTVDMTPYEIYLDFRTAPIGSLTVTASLYEAGVFIGTKVSTAFGVGYAAGTVTNDLIETYDPELEETIGGTVAEMLQQLQNAVTALSQGSVEEAFDNLFGSTPPLSYDNPGDFDVTFSMYDLFLDDCAP